MVVFNNVILGLDPGIQTANPPLDSSSRIKYGTSFAGMTKGLREVVFLDSLLSSRQYRFEVELNPWAHSSS